MSTPSPASAPPPCPPEAADEFLSRPTPAVIATLSRLPGPILVLGAGGKMGLHVCAMLKRGLEVNRQSGRVIAVSRFSTLNDRQSFEDFGVETMVCDLTDDQALAALPDAPNVFFMAGVKFGTADAPEQLKLINEKMPQSVARRFAKSRIVAYSSGCVYPFVTAASGGATEQTPMKPMGEYATSCVAREEAFARASVEFNTPVALIRLNYSVEFRYGVLVDIAKNVLAENPINLTTGFVNVIWQTDAVAQSIQALELATAPALPLNITGANVLPVRAIAARFGELFGKTPRFEGAEAPTAWLNNAAHSHRLLGAPTTSLAQMTEWIAGWLSRGHPTWNKPTGYDRRDGRF